MAFSRIFRGSPAGASDISPCNPESPLLAIDVVNDVLYINSGNGWITVGSGGGGAQFSTLPVSPENGDLESPTTGTTTYVLPSTPAHPTSSFYFVNGIKQVYGIDYSITGNDLNILGTNPSPPALGDFHEIYYS
jgi:hypothetical protein